MDDSFKGVNLFSGVATSRDSNGGTVGRGVLMLRMGVVV